MHGRPTITVGNASDRAAAWRVVTRAVRVGWLGAVALTSIIGCGTTRWTNSPRTATELLLISDAIDRSIDRMDFQYLAGEAVFLDAQYLTGTLDENYIVSSLRQKLLASACTLTEEREDAKYVVEARSGGVGTDQHDLTFGVPSVNIPPVLGSVGGVPASIPEVPLIKKTAQKGVAKLAIFAYERETGRAVWQSGAAPVNSTAKDTWIFGAGPFQRGTIYDGPKFAGSQIPVPDVLHPNDEFLRPHQGSKSRRSHQASGASDIAQRLGEKHETEPISVTSHAVFLEAAPPDDAVQLADHEQPVSDQDSAARPSTTPERK
jgi:hypothetical protein